MTEEIKQETCNCEKWSVGPEFKQFLLMILASFLGCLIALCLYSAAIKPQKHCPCPPPPPRYEAVRHFDGYQIPPRGDFRPDRPHRHHRLDAPGPKAKDFKAPIKKDAPKAPAPQN